MGNVNDVFNGQYRSIKDSASHRYSVQWTGDNLCDLDSLTREIENLIKCSDNCIPYVNSDCGGHRGDPGKELFVRRMQFGTLSPVFRSHCDDQVKCGREPWAYDRETEDIVKEYIALRTDCCRSSIKTRSTITYAENRYSNRSDMNTRF